MPQVLLNCIVRSGAVPGSQTSLKILCFLTMSYIEHIKCFLNWLSWILNNFNMYKSQTSKRVNTVLIESVPVPLYSVLAWKVLHPKDWVTMVLTNFLYFATVFPFSRGHTTGGSVHTIMNLPTLIKVVYPLTSFSPINVFFKLGSNKFF